MCGANARRPPHMTTHSSDGVGLPPRSFAAGAPRSPSAKDPANLRGHTDLALGRVRCWRSARFPARLPFADLNYQEVAKTPNRGRSSKLDHFFFFPTSGLPKLI